MSVSTVWSITTGQAGFRAQARGLAQAVAPEALELTVDLRPPWRYLPPGWSPAGLSALDPDLDRPAPPWPDLLISCGRRAAAVSIAIRRASSGRTATVHVQDPLTSPRAFDLVIAMDHDRISGPNVVKVATALHDVTPEKLAAAGHAWRSRLEQPGRPLIGVLLGGATRRQPFSADRARLLVHRLDRLRRALGARLAITPSRRTPADVSQLVAAGFGDDPDVFVWDREGDNPYFGILALSDRLVVTSDSISMISEALSTPHPVEVFGADGGRRHAVFLRGLIERGMVRRFEGDPTPPAPGGPFNATIWAAQAVRRMLDARTRSSG